MHSHTFSHSDSQIHAHLSLTYTITPKTPILKHKSHTLIHVFTWVFSLTPSHSHSSTHHTDTQTDRDASSYMHIHAYSEAHTLICTLSNSTLLHSCIKKLMLKHLNISNRTFKHIVTSLLHLFTLLHTVTLILSYKWLCSHTHTHILTNTG